MRVKRLALTAVAVVFGLAVAGSPALAAPQGPWVQPAADLSVAGQHAEQPQLTTAPDGTVTAIWTRDNGSYYIIQAATRPPGGSFGAAVNLSTAGWGAHGPQITTGSDGTSTAIWAGSNGSNDIIQASTRPPGGSFGVPVNISVPGVDAVRPQIVVAPDGTATATWESNRIIQAATRSPGGSFGDPVDLSVPALDAGKPQITTALDGTVTVVWYHSTPSHSMIQAATRPPGGSFGTPVDVSVASDDAYEDADNPQITTAPDGTATAVWNRYDGSNDIIQAAIRPPGGSFGAAVDLSVAGQDARGPQATTGPDGTATVVWKRYDGSYRIIQASTRLPGGSFGAAVDLSVTGENASEPQVTAAPDGTTTAIWYRRIGSSDIIQAATRPPGGSFAPPIELSGGGGFALEPQITTAPDGTATAIWTRNRGINGIIQSVSTARPSFALSVSKTGSGSGTVSSAPAGINCGADCSESYLSYTKVTLTARPSSGSSFLGWGGACAGTSGRTCRVSILNGQTATAVFGTLNLRVIKVTPQRPKVKPGKTVSLRVTAKNVGDGAASNARLCVTLTGAVKKALKPQGRTCQALGSLGAGKSKTRVFKLKASAKAKKGKSYQVKLKLTAKGAKAATGAIRVKVR